MKYPKRNPPYVCVCGHPKESHAIWHCQKEPCYCSKFIDRRNCKLDSRVDPIMRFFFVHQKTAAKYGYTYDELKDRTGMSIPTISRRVGLLELLGAVKKDFMGDTAALRCVWSVMLIPAKWDALIDEGIIV